MNCENPVQMVFNSLLTLENGVRPSYDTLTFLCDTNNTLRHDGNKTAHEATEADLRLSVNSMSDLDPIKQKAKELLELAYGIAGGSEGEST
jgi:hypothetical protein